MLSTHHDPHLTVEMLLAALDDSTTVSSIEAALLSLFCGLNPTKKKDIVEITSICGPLMAALRAESIISEAEVLEIMTYLLSTLAVEVPVILTAEDVITFFSYFCLYYKPGCLCFEQIVIPALNCYDFKTDIKKPSTYPLIGTAIGLYAKINDIPLEDFFKTPVYTKGVIIAYALTAYYNLTEEDFDVGCHFDPEGHCKMILVATTLKNIIFSTCVLSSVEPACRLYYEVIMAWEEAGFCFNAQDLATFLVVYAQLERSYSEKLLCCIYAKLGVPAVRNAYLDIEACVDIDLARFVANDSSSFKYSVNTSETKGRVQLSKSSPPANPIVRYRIPEYAKNARSFKDVFSFTVINLATGYESSACVFLAYSVNSKPKLL